MAALRKKRTDQERWKDKFARPAPRRQERLLSLVGVPPTQKETPESPPEQETEGRSLGPTVSPQQGLGVGGKSLGPTVGPSDTKNRLRTDPRSEVSPQQGDAILLAPLQWEVRQLLEGVDASQSITSVRRIAKQLGASIEGVKKAIRILKQVGILRTTAVRTADVQGFRVDLETKIPVRKGTLNEARGIVKRLGLTPYRRSQALRTNPPRMYVYNKNTYIQGTDITELLGVCPKKWKIREATLVAIADAYPEMDKTTFRLSLLRAVEQTKEGKPVIRNANAWLKAAFEKNGAPLVTARDIEAQVTGGQGAESSRLASPQADQSAPAARPEEDEIFQQYMAADEAQRREIDRLAEAKLETMQAVLDQVGSDKHQAILVQARIEAARIVLGGAVSSQGVSSEDSVSEKP